MLTSNRNHQASYAMHHNTMTNTPYMLPPPQYWMQHQISSPKKLFSQWFDSTQQNEYEEREQDLVYNNQLFEGNAIPSRQTSYSEHSAYMIKGQYSGYPRVTENKVISKPVKLQQASSPQFLAFDSHGVESTNPSTETKNKKRASKPESDHLKYLFESGLGHERRADSLKYTAAPGLSWKYKMEEESEHVKSQNEYSDHYHEKLESKFIATTQRKITEDNEKEDSSQNSSDNEVKSNVFLKLKETRMWRKSAGFIPLHLRQQISQKLPEDPMHTLNLDINKLVDSAINSRKQSEISDENSKDNQEDKNITGRANITQSRNQEGLAEENN